MAQRPEAVDDLRLAGENGGGTSGDVVTHPGETLGQHFGREIVAARIGSRHRAELIERSGIDDDLHGHQGPVPAALGGTRRSRHRGLARQFDAIDADGDLALVIAVAGEHVGQAAKVRLRPPHDALAVGRSVLAKAIERGGVLQSLQHVVILEPLKLHRIGQRVAARCRRLFFGTEHAEQVEGDGGGSG